MKKEEKRASELAPFCLRLNTLAPRQTKKKKGGEKRNNNSDITKKKKRTISVNHKANREPSHNYLLTKALWAEEENTLHSLITLDTIIRTVKKKKKRRPENYDTLIASGYYVAST